LEKVYMSIFGKFSIRWTGTNAPPYELEIRVVEVVNELFPVFDKYRNFILGERQSGMLVSSVVVSYPPTADSELEFDLRYDLGTGGFGLQIREKGNENVLGKLIIPGKIES
jgi:hypothetical protein